ncbi:hypothetical protein Ancab_029407 [Ancistrocladus abbreviatus]
MAIGSSDETIEDNEIDSGKIKPEWLESFLKKTFFDSCSTHQEVRRNECNRYCINCDTSICLHCVTSGCHHEHKLLKIYRHVYKDVVPLEEIGQYMDCSKIQPYRCNKSLVVALSPLPHSGPKPDNLARCVICTRRLVDATAYSYCSISCKVEAVLKQSDTFTPPIPPLEAPASPSEDTSDRGKRKQDSPENTPDLRSKRTTHQRKGIPRRSPLF